VSLSVQQEIVAVPVDELHESADNPRQITDEALRDLMHSLEADPSMLWARPVIANPDGKAVCGNIRLRGAKRLGWQTVPTYVKEFDSPAQEREWMLRDNNQYGQWVPDELQALVRRHQEEGADLALLGFPQQELRDLLSVPDTPLPDAPVEQVPVIFGVVIDCDSEAEQASLLEELSGRGLSCRALMA
jgi:ParB-like chromosome segregation protein Spo0J